MILGQRGLRRTRYASISQIQQPDLRWVTQPGIGAALPANLNFAGVAGGQNQLQAVAIDLRVAEKLIVIRQPRRQLGLDPGRQTTELQAMLIEVVAGGYIPAQQGFTIGLRLNTEVERLLGGKEIGLLAVARQQRAG